MMNLILDTVNLNNPMDLEAAGQVLALVKSYSLVAGIVSLLVIVEMAIIFKKAGKSPILAIVPIANIWVLFTIVDLPGWLCLIPVVNGVGMLFAYFKLPTKFGKSALMGLGMLFLAPVFLGLLAFSKDATYEDAPMLPKDNPPAPTPTPEQNEAQNVSAFPSDTTAPANGGPDLMAAPVAAEQGNINVVEEEKMNIAEEPALDISESVPEPVAPQVAMPEQEGVPESTTPSAFDMPAPAQPVVTPEPETPNVETLEETLVTPGPLVQEPVVPEPVAPVVEPLPEAPVSDAPVLQDGPVLEEAPAPSNEGVIEPFTPTETVDSLEATFEMPKMANDVINSDITATKKCPSCGHDNEYTNKVCSMCGASLE